MARQQELWSRYRLPEAGPLLIGILLTHLKECPPGRWFALSSFIGGILAVEEGLRDLTPWWERDKGVDRAVEGLSELLEGPLFWMGAIERGSDSEGESIFRLSPRGAWLLGLSEEAPPFPAFEPLILRPDFTVEVPPHVCPISLVSLEACAEWAGKDPSGGRRYRLTAESVNRALERGMDIEEILDLLEREGQGSLSEAQVETLRRWAEEGQRLTVRRLTVLEAKEASLLEQLARRRRVQEAFRRTLSPRAVALDEGKIEQMVKELRRLGLHPRVLLPPEEGGRPRGRSEAAYLWVAARLYLGLARLLPLPLRLPASLLDDLSARMTPEELAAAEDVVEEILSRLGDLIDGWAPYPMRPTGDVESLLPIIERAIAEERPLEITYITAGRGERTHRVVEPYRIEWRGSVPYLIAHCRLRGEERVFRVDRIEEAWIYTT
ncbi:MAG TPA: WYL domain-containing protein [Anaerolineae bacterium]|nr:WYL domain-containing protein [Anaerolineae bacterium]